MSTHARTHPTRPRTRRTTLPWVGSPVPVDLTDQLPSVADARDQLAAIAMYHFRDLVRQVAWQVGDAKAEDLVQEVIVRHLDKHDANPQSRYTSVTAYHKLRLSLITSTKNAAIDHLRRKSTRAELPVGSFSDDMLEDLVGTEGGELTLEISDEATRDLDSSALHDGLRRVDKSHAQMLRMKLSGATFGEIATYMGVSTTGAYKAYQRAMRAVQPVLERYGAGGFCDEYGPHLLLVRQEHDGADDRPLTDMIGAERAREIRLHVYGDPEVPADDGCVACRRSGAQQGSALVISLPAPLLLVPTGGLVTVGKDAAASTWGLVTGWIGDLLGSGGAATGGVVASAGVATKGAAVVAAVVLAAGGTIAVQRGVDGRPTTHATTTTHVDNSAPAVTAPRRRLTPPPSPRRTASTGMATSTPPIKARSGSPEAEFTPAPKLHVSTSRTRGAAHGSAAAEFGP